MKKKLLLVKNITCFGICIGSPEMRDFE